MAEDEDILRPASFFSWRVHYHINVHLGRKKWT